MSLLRTAKSSKLGSQRLSAYNNKDFSSRSSGQDTSRSSNGSSSIEDNNSSIADSKWQFSDVGGSLIDGSLATSMQTDEEIKDILRKATANALGKHQEDYTNSTSSMPSVMRTLSMGSGGSSSFSVSKAYGAAKQMMKDNKTKSVIPIPITTIDTSSLSREKVTMPLDKNITMASSFSISIQREEVQRGQEHVVPSKVEPTKERATKLLKEESKKRAAKLLQKLDETKKDRANNNRVKQSESESSKSTNKTQKQMLLERLEKMGVKPEEVGLSMDGTSATKSKKSTKSKKKKKNLSTKPFDDDEHTVDVGDKYVPISLNEDFMQDVMALAAGHLGGIANAKSMDEILNAKEAQPEALQLLVKPESADMDEFMKFATTKQGSQKSLLAKAKAARATPSPSLVPPLPKNKISPPPKFSKATSSLTDADWVAQDLRRKNELEQELEECTTECTMWRSELFEELENEGVTSSTHQPRLLMNAEHFPSKIEPSPSKTLSERRAAIAAKSKTMTSPPADDVFGLDALGDALTIASSMSERYVSSESSIIERKESFADKAASKAISHMALTKRTSPEDHITLFCDALENAVAPSIAGSAKQKHQKFTSQFDGDDKSTTDTNACCVSFNGMVPKSQRQQPPSTVHSTLSKIFLQKAVNAVKDTTPVALILAEKQETFDGFMIEKKESFVEKASSKANSHRALIKKFSTTDPTTAFCDGLENAVAPSLSGSLKQDSIPAAFEVDDGSTANTNTWCVSFNGMANSTPCPQPSAIRQTAVTPIQQEDDILPEEHLKVERKSPNSVLDIGTLSLQNENTVDQVSNTQDAHQSTQAPSPTNQSRKSDFLDKGSLLDQDDAFWDTLSTIASSAHFRKKEEFMNEQSKKLEDIPEDHIVLGCGVRCPWDGHKSSANKMELSAVSNTKIIAIVKPLEDDFTTASDFSAPPSIPVEITYRASNDEGIAGSSMIGKFDSIKGLSREDQPVGKTMENLQTLLSGDSSSCDSSVPPFSTSSNINRKDEGTHVTAEELELAMIRGLEMATTNDESIMNNAIPLSPTSMKRLASKYGEDDLGELPLSSPSLPSHDSDSHSARIQPVDELDEIIGKINCVDVAVFASSSNSDCPKIEVTQKQKNTRVTSMLAKFQSTTRNMNRNSSAFSDDESEDTNLVSLNQEILPSKSKIFDLGAIDKILMDGGDDVSFDTSALLLVVTRTEDENNAVSSLEDCIAEATKTSLLPVDIEERYEELQKVTATAFSAVMTEQQVLNQEDTREALLSPIKIEERFEEVELLAFLEKAPQTVTTQFTPHDSDDDSSLEVQAQKKYKKKKKGLKGKESPKSKKGKESPKSQKGKTFPQNMKKKGASLNTAFPHDIALEIDALVFEKLSPPKENVSCPSVDGNDAPQSLPFFIEKRSTPKENVSFPSIDANDSPLSLSLILEKPSTPNENISCPIVNANDAPQTTPPFTNEGNVPKSKRDPSQIKESSHSPKSPRRNPPSMEALQLPPDSPSLQRNDNALPATADQRERRSSPRNEYQPYLSRDSAETTRMSSKSHQEVFPKGDPLQSCVIEDYSVQFESPTRTHEATKESLVTPRLDSIRARLEEKRRVRNQSCSPLRSQGQYVSTVIPPRFSTPRSQMEASLIPPVSVPEVMPELVAMQEMLEKYDHMVNQLLKQNGKLKGKGVSDDNSVGADSADLRRTLVELRRENEQIISTARSGSVGRTRPSTPGRGRCPPKPEDAAPRVKATTRGQETSPTRDRNQACVRTAPSTFCAFRSPGNSISANKDLYVVESREPVFLPRRMSSPERRSSPLRIASAERRSSPLRTTSPEHRRVSPLRQRRFPSPEKYHDMYGSPSRQRIQATPDGANRWSSPEGFSGISSPERRRHLAFADESAEQARSLREQLDLARLTSQSIRTNQSNLSLELQAFKKKLNDKRMEREHMTACRVGIDELPSRVNTFSRRQAHDHDHEQDLYDVHSDSWGNYDDVRGMMISKLKHMNDAQEALVHERMRMEEQELGERDEDRLIELDRAISDIRLAEQTNSDRVMQCLDNARTFMQTDAYY